ncbi:cadherin-like and PC-esterase domain-containing protein 1 [Lineus longissimus]|uniref:cadherin-like and PC-esterase domain-containing protein 1 n=1 Tax=Lineus longissimus TaxID=88925 RepID=UPI002B4C8FDA
MMLGPFGSRQITLHRWVFTVLVTMTGCVIVLNILSSPSFSLDYSPGGIQHDRLQKGTYNTALRWRLAEAMKNQCRDDVTPYLGGVIFQPDVTLSPKFNKYISEYRTTVTYTTYHIKVWAIPESCACSARLDSRHGPTRPTNYSLGLGDNKITYFVVTNTAGDDRRVLKAYTLHIYRPSKTDGSTKVLDRSHQVCGLVQDCDLKYLPNIECGLYNDTHLKDWSDAENVIQRLPVCKTGFEQGRWLVPCGRCDDASSCDWTVGLWQPFSCRHPTKPRDEIREEFAGKTILFLGDSTNRGMMHYMIEQLNITLTEWDKTHDIKIYNNVNRGRTRFTFAYYPQFWLANEKRPNFEEALEQLIAKSEPLQNNSNTVLVVGGVQWLTSNHIKSLAATLDKLGLSGVRVMIKSFGAGFHQPVDGMRSLLLSEFTVLNRVNTALVQTASSHNYDVIDTFPITMSRFKDFMQGKCACHFHKIRELTDEGFLIPEGMRVGTTTGRYHVEGEINKLCSEMLINSICSENR